MSVKEGVEGTPRTPEQYEEIRHERLEQILEAALTVYAKAGYAAAEVADVAQAAGLARGLVYYYFHSKQALFQALFAWMQERSQREAHRILIEGTELTPRARLVLYARSLCESTIQDERYSQFYLRMFQDMGHVYAGLSSRDWPGRYVIRDWMAKVIAQGMDLGEMRRGNPDVAANAYWGALSINLGDLVRTMARDHGQIAGPGQPAQLIDEIVMFCVDGIASGGESR